METISWQAYEYEHRERSADWYWALGILAIAAAVTAILFSDILFGVLILIAAFTMALFAARPPRLLTFEIGERGIKVGRHFFPYLSLHSFWVETGHEGHRPALILRSKKALSPHIVLPLSSRNPSVRFPDPHEVRDSVLSKLPEEEQRESLAEHLLEFFGF